MGNHAELGLGKLIEGDQHRDAIHIAVAPVTAAESLSSGQHVGLENGKAVSSATCIGIVDPFLKERVQPEDKFWLFLYPNTVTGMRHQWAHPAFGDQEAVDVSDKEAAWAWMRKFAAQHYSSNEKFEFSGYSGGYHGFGGKYTAEMLIEHATDYLKTGDKHVQQGSESLRDADCYSGNNSEFWKHFKVIAGFGPADYLDDLVPFSCTC